MVWWRSHLDLGPLAQYVMPTITDLEVKIDADMKLNKHVGLVVKSSFFQLRQLSKLKPILSKQNFETVMHAFVTTRLDYCNALFFGDEWIVSRRLQMVQNTAACLLTGTRKYEHISPVLRSLHWLPIQFRIDFKLPLLTFKSLNGLATPYLSELLHPNFSWECQKLIANLKGNVFLRWQLRNCEMPFLLPLDRLPNCLILKLCLKTHLFHLPFDPWGWWHLELIC